MEIFVVLINCGITIDYVLGAVFGLWLHDPSEPTLPHGPYVIDEVNQERVSLSAYSKKAAAQIPMMDLA